MDLNALTAIELGQLLGVTDRAVRDMGEAGMPFEQVKGKVFRYQWRACLSWWMANRYRGPAAQPRGSTTPSKSDSEARLMDVKARREALRLAEIEGQMVNLDDVESEWTRKILACRGRLLTIPARLRGPLGQEVSKRVEDEVFQALAELAKEWPDA